MTNYIQDPKLRSLAEIATSLGKIKFAKGCIGKQLKILEIKVKFQKKDSLAGAPKNISLSLDRYENEFGRQKLTSLNRGLNKTIKWYQAL